MLFLNGRRTHHPDWICAPAKLVEANASLLSKAMTTISWWRGMRIYSRCDRVCCPDELRSYLRSSGRERLRRRPRRCLIQIT